MHFLCHPRCELCLKAVLQSRVSFSLLRQENLGLRGREGLRCWQAVDANGDGSIDFQDCSASPRMSKAGSLQRTVVLSAPFGSPTPRLRYSLWGVVWQHREPRTHDSGSSSGWSWNILSVSGSL